MPERPDRDTDEPFSNPLAPPEIQYDETSRSSNLTNADFRKLLTTPRATPHVSSGVGMETPLITDGAKATPGLAKEPPQETAEERRKRKKLLYAKLKRQEENTLSELAKKYRDRAKERRDGANPDYQQDDPLSSSGGYRAVAPDAKSGLDAAERRRQIIQESKFLGGDMEHTHLVKGLDYALLQKVRSEITTKEKEEEEELEKYIKEADVKPKEEEEEEIQFKTKLGMSVYRILFRNRLPERNEAFFQGRMAYVIDPEDDFAESDIPTTLMRSVVDSPMNEPEATLTTNDIVINKLTQILSYLRHGARNKKLKKKGKGKEEDKGKTIDSIYDDVGDYVPTMNKDKERHRPSERKKTTYFEKPPVEEERPKEREPKKPEPTNWQEATATAPEPPRKNEGDKKVARAQQLLHKLASEPEGYAECYPGFEEMNDAIEDSDDEVDYSKMDMGNKKGPIGRWDFDTQEEYSEYMSSKEALPKAAFQYGVKMADGRRTRRIPKGEKNDKQKLDQEWQKIQNIIHKRKSEGGGGDGDRDYKKPRH